METFAMKKLTCLCFLVAASFILAGSARAQVLIIANPSVKPADVSRSDLKDVFTGGAPNLRDGSHVVPVLLKPGAASDEFLSAYIGKNDTAFRASWRSLVFSGQGSMPKSVDSEAAVVDYVAHTPGAIGYIRAATPHEGVKVLAVR
jgi:ABC-type phosphate transport system substrate-binding protein